MRVAAESLLYQLRQTVHAFPHVGPAHRQPHPHAAWNRDHRRASALMTAEARSTGIEPGMRTRILPANSTSIADSLQLASSVAWPGLSDEAIRTCAKPDAAARSSCRQRQIWPGEPSARRATSRTTAPGAKPAATISRF